MSIKPIDQNGNDPWYKELQKTQRFSRLREEQGDKRRGGTRKIADIPVPCSHPGHNPPSHMVYPDGIYEHVCPGCGHTVIFTVANPRF